MKRIILACLLLWSAQAAAETVVVTAYYSRPQGKMASGEKINHGHYGQTIALSPDLARKFKFGQEFQLHINGIVYNVTYMDKMPHGHKRKIDFLLPSSKACRQWGVKKGELRRK